MRRAWQVGSAQQKGAADKAVASKRQEHLIVSRIDSLPSRMVGVLCRYSV